MVGIIVVVVEVDVVVGTVVVVEVVEVVVVAAVVKSLRNTICEVPLVRFLFQK